jgi:hypothetical protein
MEQKDSSKRIVKRACTLTKGKGDVIQGLDDFPPGDEGSAEGVLYFT